MTEDRRFKVGDPVQRRDGQKARIICDDAKGDCPLVVLVENEDGHEIPWQYPANGKSLLSQHDLIPAPRRRTVWMNVWPDMLTPPMDYSSVDTILVFTSREAADFNSNGGRAVGRARIELEEGRFDE